MKVGLKKLKSLHGLPASDSRFISFFISVRFQGLRCGTYVRVPVLVFGG